MIWNDDKINRLLSLGRIHGAIGGGDTPGGHGQTSANSGNQGSAGGVDEDVGDFGGSLSVDLGGGVSVSVDSRTGDVTGTSGPGVEGGLEGVRGREAELEASEQSAFGQFLSNMTAKQKGGAIGALAGQLLGIGPLAGARIGADLADAFGGPSKDQAQGPAPTQQQSVTQSTGQPEQQQMAGVSPAGGLAGGLSGGMPSMQSEGEGGLPAVRLAAAGRQSGLGAPVPAQQTLLGARPNFLDRSGVLPQVNLQAFPGALGRIG